MTRRNRAWAGLLLAIGVPLAIGGCESMARQDPLFVRDSADAFVFDQTSLFRDRPLDDSLRSSLTLTDYTVALAQTGLLRQLQRPGPYTVFAVPNQPLEAAQRDAGGHLLDPAHRAALTRQLAYTIVPGRYSTARLRGAIAKARGPISLRTLDGDLLTVSVEPATNQLVLSDPQGHLNRLWMSDMPQSNGVLYATQSMLTPGMPARPLVR